MPYIVDGNNVMGQTPGWHRDKRGARRRLLDDIAAFARSKRARVTVVFDGEPERLLPDGSAFKGVRVLYAQKGSDADSRISGLVQSAVDRRGLTVVTSDRRLASDVRSEGARVMRSGEFRRLMQETTSERCCDDHAKDEMENSDVESWLAYFGEPPASQQE
jgi:predicted RNA-binding protein with PIN domain